MTSEAAVEVMERYCMEFKHTTAGYPYRVVMHKETGAVASIGVGPLYMTTYQYLNDVAYSEGLDPYEFRKALDALDSTISRSGK